ncbi:hypothetical protein IJT93_01975 [bacterium]|nr:hypothetical protein [bacterium]
MPVAFTNILILGLLAVLGTAAAFVLANAARLYRRLLKLSGEIWADLQKRLSALSARTSKEKAEGPASADAAQLSDTAASAAYINGNSADGADTASSDKPIFAAEETPSGISERRPEAAADASEQSCALNSLPDGKRSEAAFICLGSIIFFILTAAFMMSLPLILSFWNESVNKGAHINIKLISLEIAAFTAIACAAPLFFGNKSESKRKAD